jgi:tripartite-type tricarboxylate transporter receptor subunit TctC
LDFHIGLTKHRSADPPTEEAMLTGGPFSTRSRLALAGALVGIAFGSSGTADAADYFAGKTIRIVAGFPPASAYTLYAHLAAQHLGRFIPGNPTIIVSMMPGAAGLNALNYLQEVAPRDGTVLTVPMQDLASQQLLTVKGVRYDAGKLNYIGRATANVPVHMVWHTTPIRSFDDLKRHEIITGAGGNSGTQVDLPRAQNALLGTKWKVVTGYRDDSRIAMTRGETQAGVIAATLFGGQFKPWLKEGTVRIIVQYADFRHPMFANVPTIMEFAEAEDTKAVFQFLVSLATVGRAYVAPPGVPAERVAILRRAFDAMVKDPAFLADAEKRGADLMPMSGEELAAYVAGILRTPPDIVRKTNDVIAAR